METENLTTTKEPTPAPTPAPIVIPLTITQEHLRPAPKATWKVIVISVLISLGSAMISAYLVTERASTGPARESSDATELAKALSEDWRQLYQQSVDEREALNARLKKLDAQVAELSRRIERGRAEIANLEANAPTYAEIKKGVEKASKTDAGLLKEARETLGDLGLKDIRIKRSKTPGTGTVEGPGKTTGILAD